VSRSGILLDAALACFTERGYYQTSIDAIAARGSPPRARSTGTRGQARALPRTGRPAQEAAEPLAWAVCRRPDWRAALAVVFARVPERLEHELPLVRVSLEFISHGASDEGIRRERAERKVERWTEVLGEQPGARRRRGRAPPDRRARALDGDRLCDQRDHARADQPA
jgi:hypothetical protein